MLFRVKRKRHSSPSQFKISRTAETRTRVTKGREGSITGAAEEREADASQERREKCMTSLTSRSCFVIFVESYFLTDQPIRDPFFQRS